MGPSRLLFLAIVFSGLLALGSCFECYSEYRLDNYVFETTYFQFDVINFYKNNGPPPLKQAFFVYRLPMDFKMNFVNECPGIVFFSLLIVAESMLLTHSLEQAQQVYGSAAQLAEVGMSRNHYTAMVNAWPVELAVNRVKSALRARLQLDGEPSGLEHEWGSSVSRLPSFNMSNPWHAMELVVDPVSRVPYRRMPGSDPLRRPTVDIVICHCREDLSWIADQLELVPAGATLLLYEKCKQEDHTATQAKQVVAKLRTLNKGAFQDVRIVPCADPQVRGDECSAYLMHIAVGFDFLADYTIFLQADPMDHLEMPFLNSVLRAMHQGTYAVPFLHLNRHRHVLTSTPCIQTTYAALFGREPSEIMGTYCCSQFVVSKPTIHLRDVNFYLYMLGFVDGSFKDVCLLDQIPSRSSHCYVFEFLWHVVFGEALTLPLRTEDARLPIIFRQKYGNEHEHQAEPQPIFI